MKNINFEFADKFGYKSTFTNETNDKYSAEKLINVPLLMDFIKSNLSVHNNDCFNYQNFILTIENLQPSNFNSDKIIPLIISLTNHPPYIIEIPVLGSDNKTIVKKYSLELS